MMVMIVTRWWKWDRGGTLHKVVVIEVVVGMMLMTMTAVKAIITIVAVGLVMVKRQ